MCLKYFYQLSKILQVTFSRILSVFWYAIVVVINIFIARKTLERLSCCMTWSSLFAAETGISYSPEETICFPRNIVNETVRAREAPANWNTRLFHQVSRNRGESRTESRSLPSIEPLTLLPSCPLSPGAPQSTWLDVVSHRLSYKPRHLSFSTCSLSFRYIL